jgi:hypothetical protein
MPQKGRPRQDGKGGFPDVQEAALLFPRTHLLGGRTPRRCSVIKLAFGNVRTNPDLGCRRSPDTFSQSDHLALGRQPRDGAFRRADGLAGDLEVRRILMEHLKEIDRSNPIVPVSQVARDPVPPPV